MAGRQEQAGAATATRILDVAERLVQMRGFNGFSYADVAAELKITKAALHYHFPGKAELGEALIARYAVRFAEDRDAIGRRRDDARTKLDAYARLYRDVLRERRMCLCGMLAAEFPTLPEPMRHAVVRFFEENEAWLERVLEQGREEGTLRFTGSPKQVARMIVSGLEGAMLVARPHDDLAWFQAATEGLLASLAHRKGQSRG